MDMRDHIVEVRDLLTRLEEILEPLSPEYFASSCAQLDHVGAVRFMHTMQGLNAQADAVKTTIGKVYDWSRMGLVPEKMEEAGVDGFTVTGIGRVSLTADLSVSMPDKAAGYAWLNDHDLGDLITETVNASSLKAVIRRRMRDGQEVPGEIFRISPFTRASITKA